MSQDRPDVQVAARLVARNMSTPKEHDFMILKRVARYLVGKPRLVQTFAWQDLPNIVDCYTDSDWAGDKVNRKSASGGAIYYGSHVEDLEFYSTGNCPFQWGG